MEGMRRGLSRIEIRHLNAFLVLCETSTITEAAALLGVAQPSLSQLLASLENTLGERLFDRTRHGIQLTAAGERLRADITAPLRQLTHVLRHAGPGDHRPTVAICAGATPSVLERALRALGWEARDVDWRDVPTPQQTALLLAGKLDAAIGRESHGYSRSLGTLPLGLDVGPTSALANRVEVTYADLGRYRLAWIQEQQTPSFDIHVLQHIRDRGWDPELVTLPPRTSLLRSALASDPWLVVLRPDEDCGPHHVKLTDPPVEQFWIST